jgi:ABC-type dipeptide/oligopeptide/nickel transport system ATPase component
VTHDIAETAGFDRVLVVSGGRIVEQGTPADLAAHPRSVYRSLLDAESALRRRLWADPSWRALRIDGGRILEEPARERVGV